MVPGFAVLALRGFMVILLCANEVLGGFKYIFASPYSELLLLSISPLKQLISHFVVHLRLHGFVCVAFAALAI